MSWFRLDDNCADHPKWLTIPARYRSDAWTLYTVLGSNWCARFGTNGRIPEASELRGTMGMSDKRVQRAYRHLIEARLIDELMPTRSQHEQRVDDESFATRNQVEHRIHDYLDYNISAEEDAQRRDIAKEKKRRQRARKAAEEADVPGGQIGDLKTRPDPTRTRPETPPLDKSNVVVTLSGPGDEEVQEPEFIASDPVHRSVYGSAYQALRKSWARNYEHRTGLQFNSSWFSADHARIKSFAEMIADNASGVDGARRMAEDLVNGFYASRKKNHFRWEYIQGSESEYLTRGAELRKRAAA